MIKFKFTEKNTKRIKDWISFYPNRNPGTGFYLVFSNNGYFDPRPQITTNLTSLLAIILPFFSLYFIPLSLFFCFWSWGGIYINLPWDTGKDDTPECNTYGLMIYHVDSGFPNHLWIRGLDLKIKNKKISNTWYFPWAWDFVKREVLLKDGWYTEQTGDNLWDETKWGDKILYETHPYRYVLKSGLIQDVDATVYLEKRNWKRWFGLQRDTKTYIEIKFSGEVGERSGSWKGGCLGCSYEIRPGETALECLRRMEKERKF